MQTNVTDAHPRPTGASTEADMETAMDTWMRHAEKALEQERTATARGERDSALPLIEAIHEHVRMLSEIHERRQARVGGID